MQLGFVETDTSETQRLMRLYYLVDNNLLPSDRSEWEMKASSHSSLHFDYTYEELKDEYIRLLNNKEKCDD